jgi:hypothetical protein
MFGGLNVYGGYKDKEWILWFTLFLFPKNPTQSPKANL